MRAIMLLPLGVRLTLAQFQPIYGILLWLGRVRPTLFRTAGGRGLRFGVGAEAIGIHRLGLLQQRRRLVAELLVAAVLLRRLVGERSVPLVERGIAVQM